MPVLCREDYRGLLSVHSMEILEGTERKVRNMTPDEITFKEYLDIRIKSLEDKIDSQAQFNAQHFELNELAIMKAEGAVNKHLDSMNEFRNQMKDERDTFATRESLSLGVGDLEKRVDTLEKTNSFSAGRLWMIMAFFAGIPTIISLIALFRG